MNDTTLLTIGTALRRAETNHQDVTVTYGILQATGQVAGLDGHGVIIREDSGRGHVIRLEAVIAVSMPLYDPTEPQIREH